MTKNFIARELGVYPKELGMGIEPIYNSSAGCRLNDSATPALTKNYVVPNKNIVGLYYVLLLLLSFRMFSGCYVGSRRTWSGVPSVMVC